jgi:oligopeptide transport system substrate-binding protein
VITRRKWLAASPLALAACGRVEEQYFGNTQPPKTQRLTLVLEGEPESLDPALSEGLIDSLILSLFEGLTSVHPVTGEPMAALATHYEMSSDALRYTFYLRGHPQPRGVRLPSTGELPAEYSRGRSSPSAGIRARWSDGHFVTAHDFVYSWRRALSAALAAPKAFLLYSVLHGEAVNAGRANPAELGVRTLDDLTLQVDLEQPTKYLLELLSNRVACAVPEHVIKVAGRHWTDPNRLVSSGAFKLRSRKPYDSIVIEPNPFYYDAGQVALAEVTFLVPRDRAAMLNLYQAGSATVVESLVPAILPVLRRKKDFRARRMYATDFIAINTTVPPFNDVRVRYALNMATNKQRVRDLVGAGNIPASSVIPPGGGYEPAATLPVRIADRDYDILAFDPDGARHLLKAVAAAFPPRLEYFTSNNAESTLWAQVLRGQWREHLGIDVAIVVADFPAWLDGVVNGRFRHLAASGSSASYIDPVWFLDIFNNLGGYGTHWSDPAYKLLVSEAKRTPDYTARRAKMQECERHLLRAMPVIPQGHWVNAVMVKPFVRGLGNNLLDREQLKYVWIDTNWRPS